MYIIVFTRAQRWFLSWDTWLQSIPSIFRIHSNIMSLPHPRPGLPCDLYLSGFATKFLYTFLNSPMRDTVDFIKVSSGTKLHESVRLRNRERLIWLTAIEATVQTYTPWVMECAASHARAQRFSYVSNEGNYSSRASKSRPFISKWPTQNSWYIHIIVVKKHTVSSQLL